MGYDRQAFGSRLRQAQRRSGLSQQDLATQIDSNANRVSEWMRGKQVPKVEALLRLADALDVDLHWLITGKPCPTGNLSDVVAELVRATPALSALAARGRELADRD